MCRRTQDRSFCSKEAEAVSPHHTTSKLVRCELCESRAVLYCHADDAFLCRKCDKWVHEANFLALRHIRCFLCNTCQKLTQKYLVGASREVVLPALLSFGGEERQRDYDVDQKQCSASLKLPFLFL